MKFHKTILTLLAGVLAVIGTTATVVHADGPGAPPAPDQNINSYLDQATQDLVDEMNPNVPRIRDGCVGIRQGDRPF